MSQIGRLYETDIVDGKKAYAEHIDAELDQLVAESNSQDTRISTLETNVTAHDTRITALEADGAVTTSKIADGAVTDPKIGNRTADQSISTTKADTGTLTQMLSWIVKCIKDYFGVADWKTAPTRTVEAINTDLERHKTSTDHNSLYYTKTELDPVLRNGDTLIKVEVFTINTTDNGDGTFTYTDGDGVQHFGERSAEGYQTFELQKGTYTPGENRVEVIINDTLMRSVASGGLVEIDSTHVQLTTPQGVGAEITIKYFERLGLTGEHAITHEVGGTDEIPGLIEVCNGNPASLYIGKVWIDTSV